MRPATDLAAHRTAGRAAVPGGTLAAVDEGFTGRRRRQLVAELARDLPRLGSVVRSVDAWPGTLSQWRDAAAEVAELLQRPVRAGTSVRTATMWMVVADWPRSPEELAAAAAQLARLDPPGAQA